MDVLEIIQRMEITPELTRNIESIKNITGFEQQDLSVWNTNDTNFEVEINDEDTYSNVSKCFLITDGTDWFFVIVSLLDCGAFDYTLIDISDITSIGGDIKDILQTSLTIDVPLSLVYSDDFNITGTLLDENEDAVTGAIIKLFVGSTVVDTKTTNSNGVVSFTQTPVHMGTHSFHLEFAGIDNYLNSQSSTVTRDINKETSVLSLTSPLDNTSVYTDGSLSINGALLTNDAEAISNASVLVKQSDTTIMTLTTGVNGGFSGTINASDLSTGNLSFVYETTSTYTATSQTVAITVASPSLTLTGDKSILSYADEEYCTLTATYLATDNVGKTVSFDIVDGNGDVVENIGTADTNSSGVATCRYDSAGVGDLKVVAKYSTLLSETYSLEDCYRYNTLTSNDGLFTATTGNPTVSYSSNGLSVTGTGFGDIYSYDGTLPSDFSVECTLQAFTLGLYSVSGELDVNGVGIALRDYNGYHINVYYNNGGSFVETAYVTPPFALKFVANGSNVSVYLNNTLLSTQSKGDTGIWFKLFNDRGITIKNLKIKAL